jgi:membrane protein
LGTDEPLTNCYPRETGQGDIDVTVDGTPSDSGPVRSPEGPDQPPGAPQDGGTPAPAEPDSARDASAGPGMERPAKGGDTAAQPKEERPAKGHAHRPMRVGFIHLSGVVSRVENSLPVRCLMRFGAINGRDRTLVLGGQAFTAIIPLLIVLSALGSRNDTTAVADRLSARFHVSGASAEAIRILFERPPGTTGTITITGLVVLAFALLSLTRSLQRTYEAAWQLPAVGMRGTLNAVTGFGLLISSLLVLSLLVGAVRQLPAGDAVAFGLRVGTSTAVWLLLQSMLLSRRVPIRRLVPGSIVIGIGSAVLSLYSALWMPRLIETNADRYGIIGITFAILTWLIVICFCVVVAAVISAETGGAPALRHGLPTTGRKPRAPQA